MSTIASPRDPSQPFPRRTNSSSLITPTSSSRPSLDLPGSASNSPGPNSTSTTAAPASQSKRANRAALREYYNIRNATTTPTLSITTEEDTFFPSTSDPNNPTSTNSAPPPSSELDAPSFHAPTHVSHLLATSTLPQLLRAYTRVAAEMRALDAERKALVYDNYSKLIAATETIRRMRAAAQDEGAAAGLGVVVAGGGNGEREALGEVVEGIWRMAVGVREGLREGLEEGGRGEGAAEGRRKRTRALAREVMLVPGRVRRLVEEGREEEARREWEVPRRLLERWKEMGVGGEEVGALIEEGDAALRGASEDSESESDSTAT